MDSALYVLVKAYHSNNYILQRGYTLCIKKKKKLIAKLAINWYGVNQEKNKSKCLNQQNKEIKFVTFNLSAL